MSAKAMELEPAAGEVRGRKRYIDANVLEEAKKRLRSVVDRFDTVMVSFSGGKDSLVCLHLLREVYDELGWRKKAVLFEFRDEELIPQSVIDFVMGYMNREGYEGRYYAVPMRSNKFVLGDVRTYVQWDPNRQWIRPKPECAITVLPGVKEDEVLDQYVMDEYITADLPGSVAVIVGLRADESLYRFRAVAGREVDNYISCESPKYSLVKPIYDWSERDIFKYLWERQIRYAELYDAQVFGGARLRVSTPLHSESAKFFDKWRALDPVFYEQIISVFPEMIVQERYWDDFRRGSQDEGGGGWKGNYPMTREGLLQFIADSIPDPEQQRLARKRVTDALNSVERKRKAGVPDTYGDNYGYPIEYLFQKVAGGGYKRGILHKPASRPT